MKTGTCPTCGKQNIPLGMHCRECLCDLLHNEPIGTMKEMMKSRRKTNEHRNKN